MADDASPKPEPEIVAPTPISLRREPPRDPGVIEGEATEIMEDAPAAPAETEGAPATPAVEPAEASAAESPAELVAESAPVESSAEAASVESSAEPVSEPAAFEPAAEPPASEPPAAPRRPSPPSLKLIFAAAALGAIVGAALALGAGSLVNPRAASLDAATARISALERADESRADADAEFAKRLAVVEAGEAAAAAASALDALAGRVAALESAAGKGPAPAPATDEALAEARAARDDAAKALALVGAAPQAAPAASPSPPAVDPAALAALAGRVGQLESGVAALKSGAPDVAAIDARLAKLEGALAAPKSEARVAAAEAQAPRGAAAAAILAVALEGRLAAGAPFAQELSGLSRLGADAGRIGALKPYADSGAPTLAALAAAFAKLEPSLTALATPAPARNDESVFDRLFDHMRALVRVHKVGAAGEGAEGLPAAVAAALGRGDLAAALDAYGKLPEPARQAGAEWAKSAAARQAAGAAARALRDDAVARLAAGD
jgi:hypothetical protein